AGPDGCARPGVRRGACARGRLARRRGERRDVRTVPGVPGDRRRSRRPRGSAAGALLSGILLLRLPAVVAANPIDSPWLAGWYDDADADQEVMAEGGRAEGAGALRDVSDAVLIAAADLGPLSGPGRSDMVGAH